MDMAMLKWAIRLLLVAVVCHPPVLAAQEGEEMEGLPIMVGADEEGALVDEFAFLMEEDVVESAAKHKQEIGMSPSAITVITRQDIEASGANTIPDLLRMVPGMDVVVAAPGAQAITARVYWSEENIAYLVLVDGRDATLEQLGQPVWGVQPILLEDIERIEIIRGPGSSLYGANAMSGVVSITTRSIPKRTSAWARVIGGEAGMISAATRASIRVGDWGFSLNGEVSHMGAFADPRIFGLGTHKLRGVAEYRFSETRRLMIDAGLADAEGPYTTGTGTLDAKMSLATLRAAYQSKSIRGHLYWTYSTFDGRIEAPLEFGGIHLAEFGPAGMNANTVDGEVQWTLPEFWERLLVIVGASSRLSWVQSDDMLDGKTYADITSPDYRKPGIDHFEARAGGFVHAEVAPTEVITITGSARVDYNNITGVFFSPRLAAVLKPGEGNYLRLGVARAFRKPAFQETHLHMAVAFPDDSPITGPAQDNFQEFMSRVIGNSGLKDEKLLSLEIGYLGRFLDGRLNISLDGYFNQYRNIIEMASNVVADAQGLPDLELSSYHYENIGRDLDIFGAELAVRYEVSRHLYLRASWSHREIYSYEIDGIEDRNPKNLVVLGGRFNLDSGLIGSLYIHTRSEFIDLGVENPAGILAGGVTRHMDNMALVLAKLGWKWEPGAGVAIEIGAKLFLPVSFSEPYFRAFEKGGGVTATGRRYGGFELARVVTGYLQGSF
jgi:iron complex outermembrane receptor protein